MLVVFSLCACGGDDGRVTINVYNWGEYIANGEDGTLDVIREFEKATGINVNYTTYATNEEMYAKIKNGAGDYDVIIPSDYMISRMIDEEMLEKLDFANIPNYELIMDGYKSANYDPTGEYSVPYAWGIVGIIYNKEKVTKTVDSWDILWDEEYAGKILMFNNSRDAFAIALQRLGYSINTTDLTQIDEAAKLLNEQKKVRQSLVLDEIFDLIGNETSWIAPYYAGDCLSMMENNENLAFYYPEEGFNIFIDSICIPKGAKNKEAAEAFINFLCETEIAVANCEYICYFTPHTEAAKIVEFDERIYPTDEQLAKSESYIALPDDVNSLYDSSWIEVRSSLDISEMVTVGIILGLALTVLIVLTVLRHMKKGKINY